MTRPTWTMYHPNGKGTGSALRLELHPARPNADGSILATIAPQKTVGMSNGTEHTFPTFDWEKAIRLKLDYLDLTEILQVLRGYCESIADGKGLFHRTTTANMVIKFEHRIEPVCGYMLDVARRPNGGEIERVSFFMRQTEALALSEMIANAMLYVTMGIPMVNE